MCVILYVGKTVLRCKTNKYSSGGGGGGGCNSTIHAEECVLKNNNNNNNNNQNRKRADLYVFRFKKIKDEWVLRNSKPCADCTLLIKRAGIRRVYYSFHTDQESGVVKTKATELESDYVSHGRKKQISN